jgi:hypothetical protein
MISCILLTLPLVESDSTPNEYIDCTEDDLGHIEDTLDQNYWNEDHDMDFPEQENKDEGGEFGELLPDIEVTGFMTDSESEMDSGEVQEDGETDDVEPQTQPPSSNNHSKFFNRPNCVLDLEAELLGDYTPPKKPPPTPFLQELLTEPQILSLKHYIAWRKSNGTVWAYNEH